MKRLFFVLVALMVICSGNVFAEELSIDFSGSIQTGVNAYFDKETGNGVVMYSDEYDTNDAGVAVILDGSVAKDNYGAEFEVTADNGIGFDFSYGYGWASFLDNLFTVKVGKVDDDSWVTHGDLEIDFTDDYGFQLNLQPIEGLSFGFSSSIPNVMDMDAWLDGLSFAGAYTNDAFAIQLGYLIAGEAYAGFDFTGVENLTANAEAYIQNIGVEDSSVFTTLTQTIGYSFGDIYAGILCTEEIDTAEDAKPLVCLEPAVEYAANDNVLLYLGAGFTLCDGFDSFYVNPGLCYSITEDVWFDFGYTYDSAEGAADNSIQLDFVWNY